MGLATAQLLAERGAQISLADLDERGLNAAIETLDHKTRHMCSVVDVIKGRSVDAWIMSTVERYGKIDGAVNMAGIITNAVPITEVSDKDWDFTFDVNVKGVFNCLRAELKAMASGGSIVS